MLLLMGNAGLTESWQAIVATALRRTSPERELARPPPASHCSCSKPPCCFRVRCLSGTHTDTQAHTHASSHVEEQLQTDSCRLLTDLAAESCPVNLTRPNTARLEGHSSSFLYANTGQGTVGAVAEDGSLAMRSELVCSCAGLSLWPAENVCVCSTLVHAAIMYIPLQINADPRTNEGRTRKGI